MILQQLREKFPAADYIYLYDLDQNFLYGGVMKHCPKIYIPCGIESTKIGRGCLFITLQIKDGHF